MPPRACVLCGEARAVLRRPKTGQLACRECFFHIFEEEVHETITSARLFSPGDRVAVGASGGKDSTVLAHVLTTLNERHNYGLHLVLLSIDEGITGYRDDSLETVKRNQQQYALPLTVLGYKELYGWSMDEIVASAGRKNNCACAADRHILRRLSAPGVGPRRSIPRYRPHCHRAQRRRHGRDRADEQCVHADSLAGRRSAA